jgi:hypothetical protein
MLEHDYLALLNAAGDFLILATMLVLFVRGDIMPRQAVKETIVATTAEVLDELRDRGRI